MGEEFMAVPRNVDPKIRYVRKASLPLTRVRIATRRCVFFLCVCCRSAWRIFDGGLKILRYAKSKERNILKERSREKKSVAKERSIEKTRSTSEETRKRY